MKVRTRFAPSPTGHLHVGGARTALINWLFSRHEGGGFILRIEDTDVARSKDEYTRAILDGLSWLGLSWDMDPVHQSSRLDLYRGEAERLLSLGKAYYCSCTAEELDRMREKALKEGRKPKYDGRCRSRIEHPPDRPKVIRFKSVQEGATVVDDVILGRVEFENNELDDLVILRSDGTPTYNFSAVVDDHDLGITHVIRGNDHLNNTPRQIQIYQALGYEAPSFAHHPLILGQDKAKMSKRHGATALVAYRDMGYLAEAMMNFLARIGWSYGDQEIFSRDELIKLFRLEDVGRSPGVWDPEKLRWMNGHYIRERSAEELSGLAVPFFRDKGFEVEMDQWYKRVIELYKERVETLAEFPEKSYYLFTDEIEFDEKARSKFLRSKSAGVLEKVKEKLEGLEGFDEDEIEAAFREAMEELGIKLGKIAQPVRVAVTGGTASPGIFELLSVLGKQKTVARLERAIKECRAKE